MKCPVGDSKHPRYPVRHFFHYSDGSQIHLHAMIELGGKLLFGMLHGFISKEGHANTP